MQILLRWAISAIALYITVRLGQHFHLGLGLAHGMTGIIAAVIAVAALAVVNAILRPLVQLLTLPLSCLTFGLFSFVINALMFWVVGWLVPGFYVHGWKGPLFGSIVMGLLSGLLNHVLISNREREKR